MTTTGYAPLRPTNWDPIAKLLHWTMAVAIPLVWGLAVIRDSFPRESRGSLMFLHQSIGIVVIGLLALRILWRLTHTAPAEEKTRFDPWAQWAAKGGQIALYVLMIAVPLAGVVTAFAKGHSVPFFGLFEIPTPWIEKQPFGRTVGELHETFAHILLILAFGHAVIGILHHVVLKDRTLLKMRPFARG